MGVDDDDSGTVMDSQKDTRMRDLWFQGVRRRASSKQSVVGRAVDACR